jgi:hypothetical protein
MPTATATVVPVLRRRPAAVFGRRLFLKRPFVDLLVFELNLFLLYLRASSGSVDCSAFSALSVLSTWVLPTCLRARRAR